MVDFRKLRADKPHITITDPIEIFRLIRVSVHPNTLVTKQTPTDATKVLTLQKLDEMVIAARFLFEDLCVIELTKENLITRCNTLLDDLELNSTALIKNYLLPFTLEE